MRFDSFKAFGGLAPLLVGVAMLSAQSRITLEGRVVDATGAALPAAGVFVRNLATGLEVATSVHSEERFAAAVRPGRYEVSAALAAFRRVSEQLAVGDSAPSPLTSKLSPEVTTKAPRSTSRALRAW